MTENLNQKVLCFHSLWSWKAIFSVVLNSELFNPSVTARNFTELKNYILNSENNTSVNNDIYVSNQTHNGVFPFISWVLLGICNTKTIQSYNDWTVYLMHDMWPHQETTFMTVWRKLLIIAIDKTQEWHSVGMYQAYKADTATEFETRQEANIKRVIILTDNCHRSLHATTLPHVWAVEWVILIQ